MVAPPLRGPLRVLAWTAVGLYFALGLLVLVLRYFVLPGVDQYRGDIERSLSEMLARPVAIRSMDAHWRRIWPNLRIHGLEIRDAEGRAALGFEEVEVDIAWSSLWYMAPHFARLEIKSPRLDLRRTADGRLFVAGLEIKADESSGGGVFEWLQAQDRIIIRDATVTWHDELRQAPELVLAQLNFDLRNRGQRHRFGLTAVPPVALAARLDIRGDFRSDDLGSIDTWKGQTYAELDYANLAGWGAWVDYPIEIPRGKGGLRLWIDYEHMTPTAATADVRLGRTVARLAPDLPMLDLDRVDGRLAIYRDGDGFKFQVRHFAVAKHSGIRVNPADVDLSWQPAVGDRPAHGEVSANDIDIGALSALATYLPFDTGIRKSLLAHAPRGRLRELQLAWVGEPGALASYRVKGRFDDLGLRALGATPGFSGLDGRIDGNEKGGILELATRGATIELPAVFEPSVMRLALLNASAEWTVRDGVADVSLVRASFENGDAAGAASGRYRTTGSGAGEIDLTANLTRGAGGAVWRYMPLVVGKDVRAWLRESIGGGLASATLRLKGDLDRFPFRDGSGVFEVKGPFKGARLHYAPDWPAFEDVTGDLLFVGPRMRIRAQSAKLWNVQLSDVTAEVPDLDAPDVSLAVTGKARGPTQDFLRFIDASPVSGYIDHVTKGMKSGGNGELQLRLDLPLKHIVDTQVDGRYRLSDNSLVYYDGLPPASNINGDLHFTGRGLDAKNIRGMLLGAPVSVDIATEEGNVALQANGGVVAISALRERYPYSFFEHLSGGTPWMGAVRVKKGAAEVRVESALRGVSSSLPEPFNKTAADALPVSFTFKPTDGQQRFEVRVGNTVRADVVRETASGDSSRTRGVIAIDRPDAQLPEQGMLLAVSARQLDADAWRRLANGSNGNGARASGIPYGGQQGGGKQGSNTTAGSATGGGVPPISRIDLRADESRIFGRPIHRLQLAGRAEGDTWKFDVDSQEAVGRLEWTSRESGDRLLGRLSRFDLADTGATSADVVATAERTERLPEIDLTVEHFLFHGRELGELRLTAENTASAWNTGFQIVNSDGDLAGTAHWRMPVPPQAETTALHFNVNANSIERMLGRIGYPDAVRRGTATLGGALFWSGAPTSIDYGTLSGKLTLEAERGQFKKLEPGVGRLLGILSLQSLPRRISLDFRDIFSEGFAFDNIDGQLSVDHGVMDTSDLEINGPAATVLMNGSVDIVHETQDLKVRVQPTIGETVATGVFLLNPAVGATAWLMNKIFGNPLDKVFSFDYAVTGSWADPKVEKISVQGPGIALRTEEAITP